MSKKKEIRLPLSDDPAERAEAVELAYEILCQLMRRKAPSHMIAEIEEVFRECGLIIE